MRPLRLAHIITSLGVGGAETMLAKLVASLPPDRVEQRVFGLGPDGPLGDRIRALGVPVEALGMSPRKIPVRPIFRLRRLLREYQPEITQTWLYHADWIGGHLAQKAGCPAVLWSIRNMPETALARPLTARLFRLCAQRSGTFPARIVSNSKVAAEAHVEAGYSPQKMIVIPNGFDLDPLQFSSDGRARLRQEWRVRDDEVVVGTLARVHPDKGYDVLLRAAARSPGVRFALAGEGTQTLDVPTSLQSRLILLGPRTDGIEFLSALDLLVSPSYREGFSNTIAEAMAIRRPVIVTDAGDSAHITGGFGVVPVGDAEALAAEIRRLANLSPHERERIGHSLRHRIEEHFSMPAVRDQFLRLYEEVRAECAGS